MTGAPGWPHTVRAERSGAVGLGHPPRAERSGAVGLGCVVFSLRMQKKKCCAQRYGGLGGGAPM